MDLSAHWNGVYRSKGETGVGWYQAKAAVSLDLIRRAAPRLSTPVIDVGAGASTLVDGLLESGYDDVTALDLAASGLALAQRRLGERAPCARWIVADVLDAELPAGAYGVWHDRAVFHFLTRAEDRARYVARVRHALRPGGHAIVAAFAPDSATKCSGLDVRRYGAEAMHAEFGPGFWLLDSVREEHHTPTGGVRQFTYCLCRFDSPQVGSRMRSS